MTLLSNYLIHIRRFALTSGLIAGAASVVIIAAACQGETQENETQVQTPTSATDSSTQTPATQTEATQTQTTPVSKTPTEKSATPQSKATPGQPDSTATVVVAEPVRPDSTESPTSTATKPAPTPRDTAASPTISPTGAPISSPTTGSIDSTSTPVPPTSTATPPFVAARAEPNIPIPPDRDLQELGRRLVKGYTEPDSITVSDPLTLGQKVDFSVSRDNGTVTVSGEVAYISDHVYWIFEDGFIPNPDDIREVAENFESDVWPTVTGVFGLPATPGVDGDDRLVVYNTVVRTGVAGYFSAADSYPKEVRPDSNEREAVYMSADGVALKSTEYLSVIAHELQHATHFANDPSEDSWVNEGLSEVAAEIAGFARSAASAFVRAPSTSLTAWAQDISISAANYGAANLFFAFLATHYGGNEMLTAVAQNPEDGISSVDSALVKQGFNVTADDVYADWLIANYLSTSEGPYGYTGQSIPPVRNVYTRAPDTRSGTVRSFGADYIVTSSPTGQMTIEFSGEAETSLLDAEPHSGNTCWWSNHGDSIDSTLTRSVDLRNVGSANFRYWVNYDIEEFWDYAYVMVSVDNGETWDIIETGRAIDYNPNGNAYGAGLTGKSLGWVQDSADLSEYSGQQILLRLEYITDDAVFSKGACFDDFEIPEIGWTDDTSSVGGWISEGFARVEETVPTQYLVQVIHEKKSGDPVVHRVPVGADANGRVTVEGVGDDDLIVVVISAITRRSTLPTEYTLSIRP